MKKTSIMFILIMLNSYLLKAQWPVDDVPDEVQNTLCERFPGLRANDVVWETNELYYHARIDEPDAGHDVRIDRQGNLVYIESDLPPEDVPGEISDGLAREFGPHELKEAQRLETPESTTYKLKVESDEEDHEVFVDGNGTLIRADS